MIYYTGDKHGRTERLMRFIRNHKLNGDDAIVILGDAGFNYYGYDHVNKNDKTMKETLNETGVTILCVHGNHERRPQTLPYYYEKSWRGGSVYTEDEYPNIIFAKDGEFYDLDGRNTIVIGGAYSVDKYYRQQRGLHWFDDEQPNEETKACVEAALSDKGWKADIVLTHTCPAKYVPHEAFLPMVDQSTVDRSTEDWLDSIEYRLSYTRWLCGHWHIDKNVHNMRFLMDDFITLNSY